MRYIVVVWVLLMCFALNASGQNHPPIEEAEKMAQEMAQLDLSEENMMKGWERFQSHPVTFLEMNVTGLKRSECLVICPMIRSGGTVGAYQKFVFTAYKSIDGSWHLGKVRTHGITVDTLYLDNDKLPEFRISTGWVWQGQSGESVKIYSFKGDRAVEIYSHSDSHDMSVKLMRRGQKDQQVGIKHELDFIDENQDGIKEILVTINTIHLSDSNPQSPDYTKKTTKKLRLINGKYQ